MWRVQRSRPWRRSAWFVLFFGDVQSKCLFFLGGAVSFLNLKCSCNLSVRYSQVNRQESESLLEEKLEAAASRDCVVFPVSLRFLAQVL